MLNSEELRQNIVRTILAVEAIINDINDFDGNRHELNKLNDLGRSRLSELRDDILKLETLGKEQVESSTKEEILDEVRTFRSQLSSIIQTFREVNIQCILRIETKNNSELFAVSSNPKQELRQSAVIVV